MSDYAYGTRRAPAIGGGLPGLPRPAGVAATAAAMVAGIGDGIMVGAPVLNVWESGFLEDGAIAGPHVLPFTIEDRRRVFLQVRMVPTTAIYASGFPMEIITIYDDTYISYNKAFEESTSRAGFNWSVTDGSQNLTFVPENLKAVEIRLVEFDVTVVSNQAPSLMTTFNSVNLTTPIVDPEKTYMVIGERNNYQQHWHPVWKVGEFSSTRIAAWGNGQWGYAIRMPDANTITKAFVQNSQDNLHAVIREYAW